MFQHHRGALITVDWCPCPDHMTEIMCVPTAYADGTKLKLTRVSWHDHEPYQLGAPPSRNKKKI